MMLTKRPDTNRLKKTYYDAKINEIEGKITSITDLGTTIALMMQKILNIESKYFTTFYLFTNRIIDKKDKRKRIN